MRCEKCGNTARFDRDGKCLICGHTPPTKPRFELPRVDISKLAKGLAAKERRKIEESKFIEEITKGTYEGKLKICPDCGQRSLFYNKYKNENECFNIKCLRNSVSKYLTDHVQHS